MKTSLKMWMRILALLGISLMAYFFINKIILMILLNVAVQKVFPVLRIMEIRTIASFFSGAAVAYLFFLKPLLHVIHWIQALSQGTFQEPAVTGFLSGRNFIFYKCAQFLYKEILMQMQILTDKLLQSETDRRMLEKKRREWLAGITHDLKTPLSYIQGYASMISASQYKWSDLELREFGMKIEEKSMHIKKLIDDLNTSFQSEDGKVNLQKMKMEMVEFIRKTVLDIANSPRCMEYAFSYIPESETCYLEADSILLQRALQNVLVNAVVHNTPGTEIEVRVNKQQNSFQITIADNGNGMDQETQSNLFESYYRGTPTDRPTEGSGLGMAIAKQFVELHNGSIRVASVPEQGTSIYIELPFT